MEINIMCEECYCSFDITVSDEYYMRPQEEEIANTLCRNCGKELSVSWRIEHIFKTTVRE